MKHYIIPFILALGMHLPLTAACRAKVDVGPLYAHIDALESGKTLKSYDLGGLRADGYLRLTDVFLVKPAFVGAWGKDSQLYTSSLGLAVCVPFRNNLYFTPVVGGTFTHWRTDIDIPQLGLMNLKQKVNSWGPYVGFDISWCITDEWRFGGNFQYAWSTSKTSLKPLIKGDTDHTKGPSYALYVERDINRCWSVNLAAAYNISLSKEKVGLRATGVKLGIVRWF